MGFWHRAIAWIQDQPFFGDLNIRFGIGGKGELQWIFDVLGKDPLVFAARAKLMEQRCPGYRRRALQPSNIQRTDVLEIRRPSSAHF